MSNYTVRLKFYDGTHTYIFPIVSKISDPIEGMKATVISGTRADGSIVIPGGKKSQEITISGTIFDEAGYTALATKIATMKTDVTTLSATLTLEYWTGGSWSTTWAYTVRRLDEIRFPESLRTDAQDYDITFLVTGY